MSLHLLKLCVGCESVEDLAAWRRAHPRKACVVPTRQTPRRAEELLDGGSLFWVFKGAILCRQTILGVRTIGEGPARRCAIELDPDLVRVAPAPRRPFQGWRYLSPEDAPDDLGTALEAALPESLARTLREIGAW